MTTDKVLALAHQAGMNATFDGNNAVSIRFAKLIQQQMIEDGWRQCAEGQGTTQFCGMAEELRKDAERQWVGLTGDEIENLPKGGTWWEIIRATEEILKGKNSGHI